LRPARNFVERQRPNQQRPDSCLPGHIGGGNGRGHGTSRPGRVGEGAVADSLLDAAGFNARGYASVGDFLWQPLPDGPGCVLPDVRMPGPSDLDLQAAAEVRHPARTNPGDAMAASPTAGKKCTRPLRVLNLPLRSAWPPAAMGRKLPVAEDSS